MRAMKSIQNIIIVILFLSALSCEDKFVNDIDIDIPEEELQMVINLELTHGDTIAKTFVARTANLTEVDHTFYEEALVELYKEDALLSTLEYDNESNEYVAHFDNGDLTEGEYKIEVSGIDGLEDIQATQTILNKIEILDGFYSEDGTIEQNYGYAYTVDEARITIDDPTDETNYYHIQLFGAVEDSLGNLIEEREFYISSLNPFAETSFAFNGLLLKDDSFNGTELDLSIGFSNYLTAEIISFS